MGGGGLGLGLTFDGGFLCDWANDLRYLGFAFSHLWKWGAVGWSFVSLGMKSVRVGKITPK